MQFFEKADTTALKSRDVTELGEQDFGALPKNTFEERRSSFYLLLPNSIHFQRRQDAHQPGQIKI